MRWPQHSSKPWRYRPFSISRSPGRTEFRLDNHRALILKDPASVRFQRVAFRKQLLVSDGCGLATVVNAGAVAQVNNPIISIAVIRQDLACSAS